MPPGRSLPVRELAPGAVATAIPRAAALPPQPPPLRHDVDRGAALVAPAGSACPELPLPEAWADRRIAVAIAVVVDTNGTVDRSALRVVEAPGQEASDRSFYSRIYVVGARSRVAGRGEPTDYASVVTEAVTTHVGGLVFRPAQKEGRPVRSTVLIACQRMSG